MKRGREGGGKREKERGNRKREREREREREYINSGVWRSRLSPHKISNKSEKISYEPRRNFLLLQILKNILRQRSRFCKDIL